MKDRGRKIAAKNMKWENYSSAVTEAMREKGIASIGLLFEQIIEFLNSDDQGSDVFESQISYDNLRKTLMGEMHPYSKGADDGTEYTSVSLAIAAFFKKPVEDLFGEIPEEDIWIQVGSKIKAIPMKGSIVPLSESFHGSSRADEMLEKNEFIAVVERGLLSKLPRETDQLDRKRMVKVIKSRFGFDGPALTLEETAVHHGVVRGRIRQIEVKALRRLRNVSVARDLWPYYYDSPEV